MEWRVKDYIHVCEPGEGKKSMPYKSDNRREENIDSAMRGDTERFIPMRIGRDRVSTLNQVSAQDKSDPPKLYSQPARIYPPAAN